MIIQKQFTDSKFNRQQDPDCIRVLVDSKTDLMTGLYQDRLFVGIGDKAATKVSMHTNDYLSIARDKRVAQEKAQYLLEHGHGDAISRVFTHDREDMSKKFERRMAKLTHSEDAVLLMSGYNANTGLIQAFAAPGSPVYIDLRAHASLWEGILCARAKAIPFRHNNSEDLERKIKRHGPGLVVVDALYSTSGAISPLVDIVDIAEAAECAIVVDETHSFGCQGPKGAGLVVELGLTDRVHFRTIGLSKAAAARGGIVCGSSRNMEFLRYEARPMIFSTSVLSYEAAGFMKTLDIITQESWRQKKLHRNHKVLKEGLSDLGYDVADSDAQIIGIVLGTNEMTGAFKAHLERNGVAGAPFGPPATPEGKSLMRFTVNAALDQAGIDHTLSVCKSALDTLDTSQWVCLKH